MAVSAWERFIVEVRHCVCSDSIRAGRSGDRIPVGGEIFCTHPDGPWGPPSGVKRAERDVDHTLHLAPRLKKEYSYTSTPPRAFVACSRVTVTFLPVYVY